jgi:hypothetical protein
MKNKIVTNLIMSILAIVFLVGLLSALTLTAPSSVTLTETNPSKTLTLTGDTNFNIINFDNSLTITDGEGHLVIVSITNTSTLDNVTSATFEVSADDFSDFELGEYSEILTIDAVNTTNLTENYSKTVTILLQKEFCEEENPANLEVEIEDISVEKGFGDDEDFWYPLDEVEIEVKVESPDYDVEDIEIEFCLYDTSEKECILDEDDIDISEDDFDLDEDDDITTILSFKVDPNELNEENNDYKIYVKATGEIDDSDAGEFDDEKTCASDSKEIEIITDDEFVIITDIELNAETIECGGDLRITAEIWNIGNKDIDDDEIFIRIFNFDLEIDKTVEFTRGIDSMDMEELDLIFQIPKEIDEKYYTIDIIAYDDEDMNSNDIYENEEDDKAEYDLLIKVEGNCKKQSQAIITANLESGGKAGEEMVVKVSVTNTGSEEAIYSINVDDYTEWASSAVLDKTTFSLNAGNSEEILITLDVKSDISGSKSFDIELTSEDQLVLTQPVTVSITEESGIFNRILSNLENNTILWIIGILNIILIIAIILVIIRLIAKS